MSSARQASERASRRSRSNAHPTNLLRESNRSSSATNNTMSSSVKVETRGVKRRLNENDEEEDEEGPVASSRRGVEKQRNGIESEEEDEEENADEELTGQSMLNGSNGIRTSSSIGTQRQLQRSKDGFTPGSIVRVKLNNFITYSAVEFRPGPHLNMVIGPNGTGKSSIVCALALGLGWKPALLGRAKEVASYVKHGATDATIEIELKGHEDQENVIIERKIFSADNRSEWRLDGKKAKASDVQERIDDFDINVANLCCFLPQDKVAEFARMPPAELLKETQKAAGAKGMSDQHQKLIELGKIQRNLGAKIAKEKAEIENLASRNEVLERDVRRVDERQQIVDVIEILNMRIPFEQYGQAKRQYDVAKSERNQCKADLAELKRTLEPLNERQEIMEVRSREMERDLKNRHIVIGKDTSSIQKLHSKLDEQEKQSQNLADKLSTVRKRDLERKKIIAEQIRIINRLEEATRIEPDRVDEGQFDARIKSVKSEQRELKDEEAQDAYAAEEISTEVKQLDREIDRVRLELTNIDSVKNARLETLRQTDSDVATAVQFLRENQSVFRKKVFEPVLLEISLEDPAFASAVEICVNYATLKTFVCQTREDYDTFTKVLVDEKRLRLNVVELEGSNRQFPRDYAKPISDQEARHLGFDRFIVDCIKGPPEIMQYLCESQNLHSIPYAQDSRGVNVEAIENSGHFRRYIVGNHMSTITYSTYGNRLAQTLTRDLRPARTLANAIDHDRKRSLESRLQDIGVRKSQLEKEMQEIQKRRTLTERRYETLRDQLRRMQNEKEEAMAPLIVWRKDQIKLGNARDTLADQRNKPSADEQMKQITAEWAVVNGESKDVVFKIMALMQQQVRLRSEADEAALDLLQYQEKLTALTLMKQEQEGQFEEANAIYEQATRQCVALKAEAIKLHKINQERVNEATKELTEKFQQHCDDNPNLTVNELQSRLAEKEAELEYMIAIRPGVREEYLARQRKIDELISTMQKMMKEKEKKDDKVTRLHSTWHAALKLLIDNVSERFSRAFAAVGNAGEVRIAEHEDYDQWGIEILVKFRDNEQLQLLTAHRQSGGERSISTITYLLSLTEMSRSPFSLVDEINQGMDQKYERQVHTHMVNVTCREEANQYFLITPKLLPNLVYHERIKVLVVNNGEWIPGDGFDFGKYIRRRRANAGSQQNGRPGR